MFQKVHLRLTILCAGIASVIVIILSFAYLYVSETNLKNNLLNTFRNNANSVAVSLEQYNNTISMEWLSRMEAQTNYLFFVLDNGIPFLYNQLNEKNSSRSALLKESLAACENSKKAFSMETASAFYFSWRTEYNFFSPTTKEEYCVSAIFLEHDSSTLQVMILLPMNMIKEQIRNQRIRFLLIDAAVIFLFIIFSWVFTGILLRPIEKNQKKQIQFVAAASHELRTPLAVILSAVECCLKDSEEKEQDPSHSFLYTIRQEGMRMSLLVNDMLTLSQSDNQLFSVNPKPVELDTLILDAYEAFEPMARKQGLSLSVHLPDTLLLPCMADKERIRQVIFILLHNAISYTPPGGHVDLSLSFQKEHFLISVKDNGIGIPDEEKEKIFDRFYRSEKARSEKEHFGLGLSIANEIIKSHKGTIRVKDNEGGGSVFTVILFHPVRTQ